MNKRWNRWRLAISFLLILEGTFLAPAHAESVHVKTGIIVIKPRSMKMGFSWDVHNIAKRIATRYNWNKTQLTCLNLLWQQESHWNHLSRNTSSGAYGIPQALPANKMKTAGADWMVNPVTQIKWGESYISNKYNTACIALHHEKLYGWY